MNCASCVAHRCQGYPTYPVLRTVLASQHPIEESQRGGRGEPHHSTSLRKWQVHKILSELLS